MIMRATSPTGIVLVAMLVLATALKPRRGSRASPCSGIPITSIRSTPRRRRPVGCSAFAAQPTRFELAVTPNARALGLTIPPSLQVQATQVIQSNSKEPKHGSDHSAPRPRAAQGAPDTPRRADPAVGDEGPGHHAHARAPGVRRRRDLQ